MQHNTEPLKPCALSLSLSSEIDFFLSYVGNITLALWKCLSVQGGRGSQYCVVFWDESEICRGSCCCCNRSARSLPLWCRLCQSHHCGLRLNIWTYGFFPPAILGFLPLLEFWRALVHGVCGIWVLFAQLYRWLILPAWWAYDELYKQKNQKTHTPASRNVEEHLPLKLKKVGVGEEEKILSLSWHVK